MIIEEKELMNLIGQVVTYVCEGKWTTRKAKRLFQVLQARFPDHRCEFTQDLHRPVSLVDPTKKEEPKSSIEETFGRIRSLCDNAWDGVDDPEAVIDEMRGKNEETQA